MTAPTSLFRALADRTRLRIVNLLARGSLCVCDLQQILGQPQSSVSRHLALLKSAGLIADRRDGLWVFYALTAWDTPLARGVLAALRDHLAGEADYRRDADALSRLRLRGACHLERRRRPSSRPAARGRRARLEA